VRDGISAHCIHEVGRRLVETITPQHAMIKREGPNLDRLNTLTFVLEGDLQNDDVTASPMIGNHVGNGYLSHKFPPLKKA
jgi:hypothetical protein